MGADGLDVVNAGCAEFAHGCAALRAAVAVAAQREAAGGAPLWAAVKAVKRAINNLAEFIKPRRAVCAMCLRHENETLHSRGRAGRPSAGRAG
jgi:hypothetical protein